jgi:uncharacterized protein (DUF1778 family)
MKRKSPTASGRRKSGVGADGRVNLLIRLRPEEKEALQQAAEQASTPLSIWIRAMALKAARGDQ